MSECASLLPYVSELIDTCWDVNCDVTVSCKALCIELIDTCWDVNEPKPLTEEQREEELIDTCWDVNTGLWVVRQNRG